MQLDAMLKVGGEGFGAGYEIGYPCTPLECKRLDVGGRVGYGEIRGLGEIERGFDVDLVKSEPNLEEPSSL